MDTVLHMRSLGAAAEGVKDQYADGTAAKVWEVFIGDKKQRTQNYKEFLVGLLREKGCKRVLDVACGTGVDSSMLLEEGFEVVSVDASDKMLKYALKTRWERRKEKAFDNWGMVGSIVQSQNFFFFFNEYPLDTDYSHEKKAKKNRISIQLIFCQIKLMLKFYRNQQSSRRQIG